MCTVWIGMQPSYLFLYLINSCSSSFFHTDFILTLSVATLFVFQTLGNSGYAGFEHYPLKKGQRESMKRFHLATEVVWDAKDSSKPLWVLSWGHYEMNSRGNVWGRKVFLHYRKPKLCGEDKMCKNTLTERTNNYEEEKWGVYEERKTFACICNCSRRKQSLTLCKTHCHNAVYGTLICGCKSLLWLVAYLP